MREQRVFVPSPPAQRVGHSNGIHPEDHPHATDEQKRQSLPQTRRPVHYQYDDGTEDEEIYDTRSPNSVRRYQQMPATQGPRTVVRYHRQQVPPRRSRTHEYASPVSQQQQSQTRTTKPKMKRTHAYRQWHWPVYVGLTSIAMLVVLVGGSLAVNWWHGYQDDLHYGRPRTTQYDVRVGHGDNHTLSHFLAINLNKQIEIVEFPGGDATKAKVYIGPTLVGDGEDLTPVTLEFRDVNRDGKPDMIVQIGESRTVFINDKGVFRPLHTDERIEL